MYIITNMKNFQNTILSLSLIFTIAAMLHKLNATDIEKIQSIKDDYYINELKLQDFDGNQFYLKNKKAKFYIVNLWASWCAPCIKEMASLNSLKSKDPDILVITISEDSDVNDAKQFFNSRKYDNLEKYYDYDKAFIDKIKIRGLPTTFIADSKYKIFAKVEGAIEWDSKEFIDWLYKTRSSQNN